MSSTRYPHTRPATKRYRLPAIGLVVSIAFQIPTPATTSSPIAATLPSARSASGSLLFGGSGSAMVLLPFDQMTDSGHAPVPLVRVPRLARGKRSPRQAGLDSP